MTFLHREQSIVNVKRTGLTGKPKKAFRVKRLRSGRPNGANPKSFSAVAKRRLVAFGRQTNLTPNLTTGGPSRHLHNHRRPNATKRLLATAENESGLAPFGRPLWWCGVKPILFVMPLKLHWYLVITRRLKIPWIFNFKKLNFARFKEGTLVIVKFHKFQ